MIGKIFFWAGLASIAVTAFGRERGFRQYHDDFRTTVKFQTVRSQDDTLVASDAKGETLARTYLTSHAVDFGLQGDLSNLVLEKISHSLLGSHYHFRQVLNGISVEKAEIIVSIAYEKNRIYKVYNNTFPVLEQTLYPAVTLNRDDALDMAWLDLRVHGELITKPKVRLVYLPRKDGFQLVYITNLSVGAPYGFWETTVDAVSGEVLQVRATDISRKPKADTRVAYHGPIFDRHEAFQRFHQREAARLQQKAGFRAMGSGMTFDPDPRTTLIDADLQDNDPAEDFDGTYFLVDLLDITDNAGTFRLTGPWVDIIDFEAPSTPPSTTPDGNWTQLRGDNAFNDVMTYYHLDKNQRYMQSLGFTGATGIQELSIGVDTDGLNGDDNSHFLPGSNRLGFGHGCVDDNEDADVILHEYGHAINFGINNNWSGGDTGAMGEGFGDYWAGSYSVSTPNGQAFHPEWVYSWDGHGTGNQCWPGRLLNRTDAMYDPALTYGAHQNVGGFISDELWSAPLFKSLQDLITMGESREDVDQIILEAQFGLGGGLTMRDVALATIEAALDLFPGGPHGQVFIDNFAAQNFIGDPGLTFIESSLDDTVANCDDDGFLDVGETGLLTVTLKNDSFTALSNTTATISSSADVFIDNGGVIDFPASNFPDLTVGTVEVTLNSALSRSVDLDFSITFTDTNPSITPVMADVTLLANVDETPNQRVTDDVEHGPNVWLTDLASGTTAWDVVEDGIFVSASHAWHVPDTASVLDSSLVTPLIDVNAAGDFTFSFNHRHRFEDGSWDGGVLEISTDGNTWTDIGASATPGYNGTITENEVNPISLRPAFVNDSPDYPNFTVVNVNLGTAWQGQTVQVRFRIGCDGAAGEEGWYLDNISFPTLDLPLFLERSSEPDVCTLCFGTFQEALDAMLASMNNGDWPENRSVLHYVDFLENVCVD